MLLLTHNILIAYQAACPQFDVLLSHGGVIQEEHRDFPFEDTGYNKQTLQLRLPSKLGAL